MYYSAKELAVMTDLHAFRFFSKKVLIHQFFSFFLQKYFMVFP